MKNIGIAIWLLMMLVGCAATTYWTHPEFTDRKWARDDSECSALASQAAGNTDPYRLFSDGPYQSTWRNCMIGKGYNMVDK